MAAWARSPDAQGRPGAGARPQQPAAGDNQALHAPARQQALPAVLRQCARLRVRRQIRCRAQGARIELCASTRVIQECR